MSGSDEQNNGLEIAIIGMAGRFPGATDVAQYWRNLRDGIESISFFTDEELLAAGIGRGLLRDPAYVKAGGVVEGIDMFDARFFGFNPREAEITDPQQRLFLECAWEALEDAGYDSEKYQGSIGVFAGAGMNTYLFNLLSSNDSVIDNAGSEQIAIGNSSDFLTTRVSYKMNLNGPSVTVQTSCSTSLVAVHLACQSLLNGDCDMALTGGVRVSSSQQGGYYYQQGGIVSPDGHCRAFDSRAQGTVAGGGVGIVILKRLADAVADGDTIHAVIKGSAINNDGSMKIGYTAPAVSGQADLIARAQLIAEVEPETISYIETHGTGTMLGDPIEIAALTQAFRTRTEKKGYCAIGSVKTNIGHLDTAAGIAGLIKTVLALKHKQLPPSLHFSQPNPEIDFESSPFYVNTKLAEWTSNGAPRRAGVSSFGIGGTNAHVILEEAPPQHFSSSSRNSHLLLISAKSAAALDEATRRLVEKLELHPRLQLADVAFTLQQGRRAFPYRRLVRASSLEEAVQALSAPDQSPVKSGHSEVRYRGVAFMFPGQGTQQVNMGRQLYDSEPLFREQVDRCAALLEPQLGLNLRDILYPSAGSEKSAAAQLQYTKFAQPALFVVEYALAQMLIAYGIRPEAMIGHSLGEYVAACVAGVFSLEDGLRLVAQRGRLMQSQDGGAMTAVAMSAEELRKFLMREVSVAAENGPQQSVISGRVKVIEEMEREFDLRGVSYKRLDTAYAFHSEMMEPMLEQYAEIVRRVELRAPEIPYLSNLSGEWVSGEQVKDPGYWLQQARQTVRFAKGLEELVKLEGVPLVELGPGEVLTRIVRNHWRDAEVIAGLGTVAESDGEVLGRLWLRGVEVKWEAAYEGEQRQRVGLPAYPFERQRYWVDGQTVDSEGMTRAELGKQEDLADWFYVPVWKQSRLPEAVNREEVESTWLVFVDEGRLGSALLKGIEQAGQRVICVAPGESFAELSANSFKVNPAEPQDYRLLVSALHAQGIRFQRIIHLWSLDSATRLLESGAHSRLDQESFGAAQPRGFLSLVFLAQAIAPLLRRSTAAPEPHAANQLRIDVVTAQLQDVTGDESLLAFHAPLLGLCKVIPQEYPGLFCRSIDILLEPSSPAREQRQIQQLLSELTSEAGESVVAWRGAHRWVQGVERLRIAAQGGESERLRRAGVYLITGGLGRIGLVLAHYLARAVGARLVLVGRHGLPSPDEANREATRKIARLRQIEQDGGEVQVVSADVTDEQQMREVFREARLRWGAINGVIHAAGMTGEDSLRTVQELSWSDCQRQFAAKVYGAIVLEKVLGEQEEQADFCVLISSLASILGGLGFAAYAGANRFLDLMAQEQSRKAGVAWMSMNWDGWSFPADADGAEARQGALGESVRKLTMTAEEGTEAFRRVMRVQGIPQVAVSTGDLASRIQMWTNPGATTGSETSATKRDRAKLHARPELSNPYERARDAEEQLMVQVWENLLGIDGIGIDDNFFELGGHSLLATQVVSRMRAELGVEVALRSIFEEPTIAGLIKLTRREAGVGRGDDRIKRVARDEELPLSFAQQRLWFIDQLEPGSAAYNLSVGLRMRGKLAHRELERSLSEIVRRHEVLRTTFESRDGPPIQIISPPTDIHLAVTDFSSLSDHERNARLEQLAVADANEPFDLQHGPLIRLKLLRLGAEDHVLLCTMHHIVSDGWSMGILIREVGALYEAYSEGKASPLPELEIQYADYAVWQRQMLNSGVLAQQLAYWKQHLAGAPALLDLPTDRPRPPVQSNRGARLPIHLDQRLTEELQAVSQRKGMTLFMTLLAAFQVLLYRYTSAPDVVVGTPIANRTRTETEGLIGIFLNALVLRTSLAGEPDWQQVLQRTREVCLEAYAHQEVPFEILVEELDPERVMSHELLFQVMLLLQNAPQEELKLKGLELGGAEIKLATSEYDLKLVLMEEADGLRGEFEYKTDLFDAATISRIARHYECLLAAMISDPGQLISRARMLTDAEQHQLLVAWNQTQRDYPRETCAHHLIEAQAERAPQAVALVYEDEQLSYQELNSRANQLANHMRARGVRPEVVVAICLERSFEMIVAVLAVLKTGGAYVPLDPTYPRERLAFIAEDAGVALLLTQESLAENLRSIRAETICLDTEWAEISEQGTENPPVEVDPENLAYVIYTSGSSGKPKGVMLQHRGLCNLALDQVRAFEVSPASRFLQFASFSFDASVSEIFTALFAGATLCLAHRYDLLPGGDLLGRLRQLQVSVALLPPSVLASLPADELPALRSIIAVGETCPAEVVDRWAPDRLFINGYGPTEVTIGASFAACADGQRKPPIGRPFANVEIYILDAQLQPAPVGVPGHLHVASPGLARGYLNQPGLTAEKFMPHPFSSESGARLYGTGDLARYLADGNIEFLGRIDDQVKVRGYRIELGEIQALLNEHEAVRQSVVIARQLGNESARLIAYVVPHRRSPPAAIELWPSVAEYFIYDEILYYAMINDQVRTAGYRAAIGRAVQDKVVVDIGTGPEAILARFCVEAGARKVYAIELLDHSYERAVETVTRLGLADRIIVIHGDACQVELPEPVEVCVSALVGPIGGVEGAGVILNGARRFLTEEGVMIPRLSRTMMAAVTLPDEWLAQPGFSATTKGYVEKIFMEVGHQFDLRLCLKGLTEEALLSERGVFEELNFGMMVESQYTRAERLRITRAGRMDGLLVWLVLELDEEADAIDILAQPTCWLPVYLPVFEQGVEVDAGDEVELAVRGRLSANGVNPDYEVSGALRRVNGEVLEISYHSEHFGASHGGRGLYGELFSDGQIRVKESESERDGEQELGRELRAYLKERLPEYMVPSAFAQLEQIPLTPQGKVDRKALPNPDQATGQDGRYEAPRNAEEELIAGIWSEVLQVERVGIHDNFFELGGHSLIATQVVSRMRAIFNVEIPLRTLFEGPTVTALANNIEAAIRTGDNLQAPPLVPVSRDTDLPLSFAQERLWFLDYLVPGGSVYNSPLALRVAGPLDIAALEQSLSEVVRRHEVLRTCFGNKDGRAIQIISPARMVTFPVTDLSELMESEQQLRVKELAMAESNEPFDLAQGPLLRIKLLRLDVDDHVLLVTLHHIISDGWSMGILTQEVAALYEAYLGGEASSLPELKIQYADYAVWQREWLQGEVLERELEYWREHLSGAPAVLKLPLDRPRPAVQSYRGAFAQVQVGAELRAGLKAVSQQEKVTLFMSLLAAYQVLLWRYSGESEVVVGTPIANRTQSETEALIGFFVNTLALRTHVSGELTWQELLGQVREVCLGAYAHQDVPFEKLVDEIQTERNLSHSAVFQVMLVLQNASGGVPQQLAGQPQQLPGLRLSGMETGTNTAKFDLTLLVDETEEALYGTFEYNTDLFEAETIQRLAGHYERLLEAMVGDPEQLIVHAELLSEAERRQLLVEWNETEVLLPADQCVHWLFEEQVKRTPDAAAVVFQTQSLTFAELNRRANQLANHLQNLRVGPEVLVGLCVERSLEMVIGLLGVLKAGGAYVPLDPAYPLERLSFMLEDAAVPVLLTQQKLIDKLPALQVLCLDTDWELIAQQPDSNPHHQTSSQNLLYVIYTSGSTGRPKGAMNTHRGVVNRQLWMQQAYPLTPADKVLQLSSFSFDFSFWEILGTLSAGAQVVLPEPGGQRDTAYLRNLIIAEQVTVVHFVPSMLQVFLEQEGVESCTSVRRVFSGGEALPFEVKERFFGLFGAELHNQYGPTEASIDVTYWDCGKAGERRVVPIGRPNANNRIYVLDKYEQPVGIGIAGEIFIGGVAVGRGYLKRPGLTAERFTPDPFSGEEGARLYRTGDLGRYLADGSIEYLGRLDDQVKVRGFRIELGEIEAVLREQSAVRAAVAVVQEDTLGDKRLVAFVVAEPEGAVEVEELRQQLKERLPEYMVPWAIVRLAELPLTTNGKVDRQALARYEALHPRPEAVWVAPQTKVEQAIAAIWEEVLGLERVGVHDNFFELGGHSLLLIRVHLKLQAEFSNDLTLIELFEFPTIRSLAHHFNGKEDQPSFQAVYDRAELRRDRRKARRQHVEEVIETAIDGEMT